MNPQWIPTWSEDFLSQEVRQSQTEETIKSDTLAALEQARQIQQRFWDDINVQQEYEQVRLATIWALRNLRINTIQDLNQVRLSLTWNVDFNNLSDWDISSEEYRRIQEEVQDLHDLQDSEDITSPSLSSLSSSVNLFSSRDPLQSSPLQSRPISTEIETWGMSIRPWQEINQETEAVQERAARIAEMLEQWFISHSGSREEFINFIWLSANGDFRDTEYFSYFYEEPYSREIFYLISNNPHYLELYVENDLSLVPWCSGWEVGDKIIQLQTQIREAYLELQEDRTKQSIIHYLLNSWVSEYQIEEVEESGGFDQLIRDLRNGDCNVTNIWKIRQFNQTYFNGHEITLTSEDATNILGSIISLEKTDNQLALANLRDELSEITGRTFGEIQIILDSWDASTIGEFLDAYRTNTRIWEIEGEIFELLDIRREILAQEWRLEEVAANAEAIYNMSDTERAEYTRLLRSLTWASIRIDISREVHRNYILANPKERLILLNSAEDVAQMLPEANEVLRDSWSGEKIEISDVNPDYLIHPDVIRYFIEQDNIRDQIVWNLPLEVFQNQELSNIVFQGSRFLWKSLFQNILSANSQDTAIEIISSLIEDNLDIAQEYRERLEASIPTEIYSQILWYDIERVSIIQSFTDNIELLIHPPVLDPTWDILSPVVWWWITQPSPDFIPVGFDEHGLTRDLVQYIRENGLTAEVLAGIQRLIDEQRWLNVVAEVLPMLHAGNPDHVAFAENAIQKRTEERENGEITETSRANNYIYLNVAMQSHPDIIQEMGSYGIVEFKPSIIQHLRSEKLFAQYLIWYLNNDENDIQDLRRHQNIELLRRNIWESSSEELTEEEVRALNRFYQRTREIEENIDSFEGDLESINENQRQQIRSILENISGLEWAVIDSLFENNPDLENHAAIDSFLLQVWQTLERIWKNDEEIWTIIQEILNINAEADGQRVVFIDRQGVDITPNMSRILNAQWFLLTWDISETPSIDYDGLTREYLEIYRQENTLEQNLDNAEVIKAYLLNLWLTEEEAESITENISTRVRREISRRTADEYPWESWRGDLENPPGLYGRTQQRMLEEIANWDYQYIWRGNNESHTRETRTTDQLPTEINRSNEIFPETRIALLENGFNSEDIATITPEERATINGSPEALNRFIILRKSLTYYKLEDVFPLRHQIFAQIGNKFDTGWFNVRDGDYLNEKELSIFLYTIIYATREVFDQGRHVSEIESYRESKQDIKKIWPLIERLQNIWGFTERWDENILNGWGIGKTFLDMFTQRDKGNGISPHFKLWDFTEAIEWM